MKLLITGGAGYIGSHVLVRCLEQGHDVVVADNFSNSSPATINRVRDIAERSFDFYRCDVRDSTNLERIFSRHRFDAVLHFAGLKSVTESVGRPLHYFEVNVGGSLTLLQAMAASNIHTIVFSSTASIYGQGPTPLAEDSPIGSRLNPYGRSKLFIEQALQDMCAADPRWRVGVLRYFNPIGAHPCGRIGEDPRAEPANLVPYIVQVAAGRLPELMIYGNDYETPDGTGIRDYVHVMDLADGHLAALSHLQNTSGWRVWNLGTGSGRSVLEVVEMFERVTGMRVPFRFAPRRPGDVAECWADPHKAMLELGWSAKLDLPQMLEDHWRWQTLNPLGYAE